MFDIVRKEIDWGGRPLVLETGRIARQADAAVMASLGETAVLCTVVAEKSPRVGLDFFPLTVNYQEKTYAAGKIPGGFFKREARPSEKETLTSRLIDRPIRPLFAKGFRNETQIICTVMSHDLENDPDIVALVGTSAALTLSGIPFLGPIAGARVGVIDGELVLNPTTEQMQSSTLDLVVAGTSQGVLMVESEAQELPEQQMLDAVMFGHRGFLPVIDAIIDMAEECAKDPWDLPDPEAGAEEAKTKVYEMGGAPVADAYALREKQARQNAISAAKTEVLAKLEEAGTDPALAAPFFKDLERDIVRGAILDTSKRIDDRDLDTVRPIDCQVGILPRQHGSALFTRGETQAIVVSTLGTSAGRADCRCAGRRIPRAFHAPLQLPALLDWRSKVSACARPAGNRPWKAGLARCPAAAAEEGGLPLHRSGGLRNH